MRKAWWCFGFLITCTIVFIIFLLGTFPGTEPVKAWAGRRWNGFDDAAEEGEDDGEQFKKIQERLQLSPTNLGRVKTILYWNTMYAEKHRHFMFGSGDVFQGCPQPNCYGTPDRHLLDNLQDFDAILFHGIEMNLQDLPDSRSSHQRYIFFSWESSASRPLTALYFVLTPNYYNWTMSYRLDSDIRRPYGRIRDRQTQEVLAPPQNPAATVPWKIPTSYEVTSAELEIIKSKNRIAAWMVSHCETRSRRETLVKQLGKHLEIDVYGKCGDLKCDQNNNDQCWDLIEQDYFFYFSFENTLCRDYVTEKLFLPMSRYIIPVVYGGADYTKFAPPHSHINIMDFNSTAELAAYLLQLSKNPTEYASYFWWKKYYTVEDTTKSTLCDLCEKLHGNSPKKTVDDFEKYYITDQCYPPGNLSWVKTMPRW